MRIVGAIQYSGPLDNENLDWATKAVRFMVLEKPRLKVSDLLDIWQILPHMRLILPQKDGTTMIPCFSPLGDRFSEEKFSVNEVLGYGTWLVRAA